MKKHLVIDMSFFTVSFSRSTPSRSVLFSKRFLPPSIWEKSGFSRKSQNGLKVGEKWVFDLLFTHFCTQKPTFGPTYDRAKVPLYNGNDPPPAPGSLKTLLFPPLLNKVQNKGTQGVRARCGAELPPFISIVLCPGRPVILGMDLQKSLGNFSEQSPG